MKKFILKILLYSIPFLVVIGYALFKIPKMFGNPVYDYKLSKTKEISSNYNLVIFGSSRSQKHISTTILDSVLSFQNIHSANLAEGGVFNGEAFYVLKNFLANKDFNPKCVLFELQALNQIASTNVSSKRTYYWADNEEYTFTKNCLFASNQFTEIEKASFLKNYTKAHKQHILNGSLIKNYLNSKNPEVPVGTSLSSFEFLDTLNEDIDEALQIGRRTLLKNPAMLEERRQSNIEINFKADYIEPYLNRIELLNKICKEKGIKLILLLPPRQDRHQSNYLKTVLQKTTIPSIDLSSPNLYPQFYNLQTSYDVGHMQAKAATEYSQILASKLSDIL